MKKYKNISTVLLTGIVLAVLSAACWFKVPQPYSYSERRRLARMPKLSAETLRTGQFMSGFESYTADQFPLRDSFRHLKAVSERYVFGKKDSHGIYCIDGNFSQLQYPMQEYRVMLNIRKINQIQNRYLNNTDCHSYLAVIPDKNFFLAPLGHYPVMDYGSMEKRMIQGIDAEYIPLYDLLSLEDYYRTDQHWRQEKILDVAERIGSTMGSYVPLDYQEQVLEEPFYGAYVGQAALKAEPDAIHYLTGELLEQCLVTSYGNGSAEEVPVYDMEKAHGRDPYEMFLSGSDPLLVIENPQCANGKELVVFRDSFGSSLIPLLVGQYEKITVVDLRYMQSSMLDSYVTFDHQDVLFLYSTLVLNNTISM